MNTQDFIIDPLTEAKPKKKYNNKKYTDAFYEKHKGEKVECKICNVNISRLNYSHHLRSDKHSNNLKKEEEKKKHVELFNKRVDLLNEMKLDEKTYFIMKQLLS
jgi:hypothetical protein